MENKMPKQVRIPNYQLVIAGKQIPSPLENQHAWARYDFEDKTIVIYDVIDPKKFCSNSNVVAFDSNGNQLWIVQALFSEALGPESYTSLWWDESIQKYYLNSFNGEGVQVDLNTGKIIRDGRHIYPR